MNIAIHTSHSRNNGKHLASEAYLKPMEMLVNNGQIKTYAILQWKVRINLEVF